MRLSWKEPEADWMPQWISSSVVDEDMPGLSGAELVSALEKCLLLGKESDEWCLMECIEMSKGRSSIGSMILRLLKIEVTSGSALAGEARKNWAVLSLLA
jgi:hypothetical protein